jgi:DNA-binding GntR family transcriptional regulator
MVWHRAASTGLRMPPEDELVIELGASKPSIREALVRLEAEGLVRRQVGAGTFPNPLALEMPARLDQETDFADMLRSAGFTPSVDVLDAGWSELTAHQARQLDRDVGARAYRTRKRWCADGVPVMVAVDVIPVRSTAIEAPDPETTVVELAHRLGAGKAEWICTWPGAANCDAETSGRLDVEPGDAVLTLEHVGVARSGRRSFWAFEHHRPGYLRYGLILNV